MGSTKPLTDRSRRLAAKAFPASCLLLMFWTAGCGSATKTTNDAQTQPGPQSYLAPHVSGTTSAGGSQVFVIDDVAGTFSQTVYDDFDKVLPGAQIISAGDVAIGKRGLRDLGITVNYISGSTGFEPVIYNPAKTGSFAVELVDQAGGFVQLVKQPVAPMVATTQCPNLNAPQTYQFVTIPAPLITPNSNSSAQSWDPSTETAYGSVDVSSSGSTVTFQNIHQFTLPSVGGSGAPAKPAATPATGVCGPTSFGNITNLPGELVITNPGGSSSTSAQAKIGIGPNGGLLVEDNDSGGIEVLGAGTGAVGLPKPSSALDTSAIAGAQYLGFIYAPGFQPLNSGSSAVWSSHLASFGFAGYPTLPSACSTFAMQTGTLVNGIYGGDFPQNNGQDNPSASPDGFGNCDFAIDLGTQITSNNSLYTQATVWIHSSYVGNSTGKTYSFPAVAIAGQLNGKYAIFVLGVDSTQPWAIYLLQSSN